LESLQLQDGVLKNGRENKNQEDQKNKNNQLFSQLR
jgi:hypothetical protein